MNKNIKIAKELIKLAKNLIQEEKTAKWDWKHPFTFNKNKQDINKLEDEIKKGQVTDIIIMKAIKSTTYDHSMHHGGDEEETIGIIIAGKDVNVEKAKSEIQQKTEDFEFIENNKWRHRDYSDYLEVVKNFPTELSDGTKIVWSTYKVPNKTVEE